MMGNGVNDWRFVEGVGWRHSDPMAAAAAYGGGGGGEGMSARGNT